MDAITIEQMERIFLPYINFPNYLIGFAVMFICFLFGCYINSSFRDNDGIDEGDLIGTTLVSVIWPLTVLFFLIYAVDKSFKFFAKIFTSKFK